MPSAQFAPLSRLPKGKTVYLTLESRSEGRSNELASLKNAFGGAVRFISISGSSPEGKAFAQLYLIEKMPAAVLLDRNHKVAAKAQGALVSPEMRLALRDIVMREQETRK